MYALGNSFRFLLSDGEKFCKELPRRAELRLLSEASFPVLYHYSEAQRAELHLLSEANFPVLYNYSEARSAELCFLSIDIFNCISKSVFAM